MVVHSVSRLPVGGIAVGGATVLGWWLTEVEDDGRGPVVAGPFATRAEAGWATAEHPPGTVETVYGVRRPDGRVKRRPSPQEWAWLAHLGEQLGRLPGEWEEVVDDEDPLTTLVVEVTAALAEAGLPLHDATGEDAALGGAVLRCEPDLDGIVVTWRQHERMSVDQVHGAAAEDAVQQVMSRAVADVLAVRGFDVEAFGGGCGHVVRRAT
ncbi:hypothetical protein DQ240_19825 [Blastococcus sp. TF02A-26]|nr:hypothetical protein DQ240_19825 [Blastococcus sp. TF02A-26]